MSEMSIYSARGLGSFALCKLVNCIFDCFFFFYLHWFIVYILQIVSMGIAVIPALLNPTCSPHENQRVGKAAFISWRSHRMRSLPIYTVF